MPYLNLDDNFADHPKVEELTDGAFRLHVAALCHCAKHTTDGLVRDHKVSRLTPGYKRSHVDELVLGGLWRPHDEGYEIHDYLDWNKSAAWWSEKRKKDAERKAKWRAEHENKGQGES